MAIDYFYRSQSITYVGASGIGDVRESEEVIAGDNEETARRP